MLLLTRAALALDLDVLLSRHPLQGFLHEVLPFPDSLSDTLPEPLI